MSRSEVEVGFLLVCGHHNVAFLDNWTSDKPQCRISILRQTSSLLNFTLSCPPSRIISEAHTTFRYCCPPVCLLLVCVQDSERSGPNKLARMSLLTTDPILTHVRKTTWRNTEIVNTLYIPSANKLLPFTSSIDQGCISDMFREKEAE